MFGLDDLSLTLRSAEGAHLFGDMRSSTAVSSAAVNEVNQPVANGSSNAPSTAGAIGPPLTVSTVNDLMSLPTASYTCSSLSGGSLYTSSSHAPVSVSFVLNGVSTPVTSYGLSAASAPAPFGGSAAYQTPYSYHPASGAYNVGANFPMSMVCNSGARPAGFTHDGRLGTDAYGRQHGTSSYNMNHDVSHGYALQGGMHFASQPDAAFQSTNPFQPTNLTSHGMFASNISLTPSQIASRHVISKELPAFSGKPEEWPVFITNFEQSTERCGYTDQENLIRLQKSLKGPALEAVRGKLMLPSTVCNAINTLKMLYGRPEIIHQSLHQKLLQQPPIKSDQLDELINFALAVQNYRSTMEALGLVNYLNNPSLLHDLVSRLPADLKLSWSRHRLRLLCVNIAVFDDWLFELASCAREVTPFQEYKFEDAVEKKIVNKTKSRLLVHDVVQKEEEENENVRDDKVLCTAAAENRSAVCLNCDGHHKLADCKQFIEFTPNQRMAFVREKKLCFKCFKRHFVNQCYSKKPCGVMNCKVNHNYLLHGASDVVTSGHQANVAVQENATLMFHNKEQARTLFRYIPVTLFNGLASIKVLALIDEGSACTLIENEVAQFLALSGRQEELCLKWTGDVVHNEPNSKIVSVSIGSGKGKSHRYVLNNVRTIENLDLPLQSLSKEDIKKRPHFKNISIQPYEAARARILIGIDNAKVGVPLKIREAKDDSLIATKTRIGWCVYGRNSGTDGVNYRVMHICPCNAMSQLDDIVKANFALEAVGVKPDIKQMNSKEDERAFQIMEATTKYIAEDKRWETGLLWRFDSINLPDSYPMALRRFQCLEKKMARDPTLREYLHKQIQSYLEKGYVRRLADNEKLPKSKTWFIPIFTVFNKNKGKTRLVWDAAAKVNNTALNTVLLKGPEFTASLVGILIRFRERKVAICGDIREMFHQIRVAADDHAAQQFLWRDDETSENPTKYVMMVMTFGAACSPSLANYIRDRNAKRFASRYSAAVEAICKNTFVDDWLQSADSEAELTKLALEVKRIHADGGFEMRNWISNSSLVLKDLAGSSEEPIIRLVEPDKSQEKVLGMWWRPNSDELVFMQKFVDQGRDRSNKPTKRDVLRILMSIFDPLGLLAHYLVRAKIILQKIWRSSVSWDEPIKQSECDEWWAWLGLLPQINELRIPRCYTKGGAATPAELHIFVDASENAYAAAAFLRTVSAKAVSCALIASKTRVAPLKPISIPRLELMAAILGLRLAQFIEQEMSITLCRRIFWTDSRNVLCWIRSDARSYHQFVAVRIGEILESSNIEEWRWVPSALNVADDATKCNGDAIGHDERWFTGPKFLYDEEDTWPRADLKGNSTQESLFYADRVVCAPSPFWTLVPDASRFSKWEVLRRTQALVLSFVNKSLRPVNAKISRTLVEMLNVSSVDDVESIIIRKCQEEAFPAELKCLREGNAIAKESWLYKCSPFIDAKGVIRVKGRINAIEDVQWDVKRPIILPRHHRVTELVTEFFHRRFHHHHNEIVTNEMRQRYCVAGLRALVRVVAKNCQYCRNKNATPRNPEMAELPLERLAVFTHPFTYTGVDFFGPLDVAVGRRREKRWGALFTCMTSRSVHIELAHSLSTDDFLLAFKEFVNRRGVPRRILSDNGTNFRGASRVLATEIEKISSGDLERKFPNIEWRFIPPASPHMGGAWERMIRSAKAILTEITQGHIVQEHVLRAALTDVEHILNSRPLTYVPLDTPEGDALTPNHFLLGSSSGIREHGQESACGQTLRKYFDISNEIANRFWKRWLREYLPHLTRRAKGYQPPLDPIEIDDVVIVVDDNSKRNSWPKGVVVTLNHSKDGQARSATMRTAEGLMTRPIVKLAKLDVKGGKHSEMC